MRLCPLAEFTDLLPWIWSGRQQNRQRNHRDRYTNSTGQPPPVPIIYREHKRIRHPKKRTKNLSAVELKSGDDGAAGGSETDGYGAGIGQAANQEIGRRRIRSLTSGVAGVLPSSAWAPLGGVNRAADADAELNWRCHHHRPPTSLSLAQSPSLPTPA